MLEIVDLETLATIVNDFDAIVTQGMTKRERVLGVPFPDIFSGTRRCEKHIYEVGQYRRCVEPCKYAHANDEDTPWHNTFQQLTTLFSRMFVVDHTSLSLDDVCEVVRIGFHNIDAVVEDERLTQLEFENVEITYQVV